jgi:hypothetical protein
MKNTKAKKNKLLGSNRLIALYMLIVSAVLFSCSKKELPANDFIKFVEDKNNGLKVSKNIGEIDYTLQYKPIDYILLKENNNSDIKERKESLDGMQYYTLTYSLVKNNKDILKDNLTSSEEYYERVNYFSFGLQKDIYLIDGNDTLDCKLFNYVRSYGLSPGADFVLAFNKNLQPQITDKLMVIEDKIFGGGIIKIKIAKEDIENIPELK